MAAFSYNIATNSMESKKIQIHYRNDTDDVDFKVLVFAQNFSPSILNFKKQHYVAWRVLDAQTESKFTYSSDFEVMATYYDADQEVISGPFKADLGSTWQITQEGEDATALLTESKCYS